MLRFLLAVALAAICRAQSTVPLPVAFSFEAPATGGAPAGWGVSDSAVTLDHEIVHSGQSSARIERRAANANAFGGISKSLPVEFAGKTIEMRGFLRSENVTNFVGMWLRVDGDARGGLAFDSIEKLKVAGTTGWTEYSIRVPLTADGRKLFFGVFVSGTGTVWADDIEMLVDGKPIWEAPKVEHVKTILENDHEFDSGSNISLTSLSSVQLQNLVTLGKVWGFLKYHHPLVIAGKRHWDYELFRVLPALLAAPDRAAANAATAKWLAGLGETAPCNPCASLPDAGLQLRPALDWIKDKTTMEEALSAALLKIYANRPTTGQFYISPAPGASNALFQNELAYPSIKIPDAGFQILAVYRFWNIVEYWFPNRDIIGESWDGVLQDALPKIALAKDRDAYQLQLMAMIARIHDSHANLWSSLAVRPPTGACQLTVNIRFIGADAVVWSYSADEAGKATGLKPGDVIAELDGVPVSKLVESWTPYYAASNQAAQLRDMGRAMTRGACGPASLRVVRDHDTLAMKAIRVPAASVKPATTHDRAGDTFQRLSQDVAYIKLSSIRNADVARYIDEAAGTKGLVIDIRNYPSEFVVFTLGQLLVTKKTEFVTFSHPDLNNPGAFPWMPPGTLTPAKPRYSGKVIILVDEVSQSQAAYTTMALRASGAKVLGSTTAGADGNVSEFPLPGGLSSRVSGLGVFYPDKRGTQRVGIVPDIELRPTIAGIRAGRDELLDAAIAEIMKL